MTDAPLSSCLQPFCTADNAKADATDTQIRGFITSRHAHIVPANTFDLQWLIALSWAVRFCPAQGRKSRLQPVHACLHVQSA